MRVSSERRTRVATATCTSATALRHQKNDRPPPRLGARATVPHAHWAKFCESPVSRRDWPAAVLCAATGLETLRLRSSAPGKGTSWDGHDHTMIGHRHPPLFTQASTVLTTSRSCPFLLRPCACHTLEPSRSGGPTRHDALRPPVQPARSAWRAA